MSDGLAGPIPKLLLDGDAGPAGFGGDVAIDGDTAVVSARGRDEIVVFDRDIDAPSGWSAVAKTSRPGDATSSFGGSVAVSTNTILVGDPRQDVSALSHTVVPIALR